MKGDPFLAINGDMYIKCFIFMCSFMLEGKIVTFFALVMVFTTIFHRRIDAEQGRKIRNKEEQKDK